MKIRSSSLIIAALLCGLLPTASFSQDAAYTVTPPPERNIQAALDLPGNGNEGSRLTASLAYQWKARRWMHLKAGVFYGIVQDGRRTDYIPIAADTLLVTNVYQGYRLGGITLGVESRRHFYKTLSAVAGLDALLGYGSGTAHYDQEYRSGSIPFSRTYGVPRRTEHSYGSMVKASFRGYTGLRLMPGRHLIAGLDIGLWIHSEYLRRATTGDLYNLSLNAPCFRVLAGWRF